jgi:hypothetical protein
MKHAAILSKRVSRDDMSHKQVRILSPVNKGLSRLILSAVSIILGWMLIKTYMALSNAWLIKHKLGKKINDVIATASRYKPQPVVKESYVLPKEIV